MNKDCLLIGQQHILRIRKDVEEEKEDTLAFFKIKKYYPIPARRIELVLIIKKWTWDIEYLVSDYFSE